MAFVSRQLLFASQLEARFAAKLDAGTISSYSASLLSGTTQSAWFSALGLPSSPPGSANGLALLDSGGRVPTAQLPASIVGAMFPKGGWNASTNNPALASGVGTKGDFYVVTTSGSTSLDGNSSWSASAGGSDCLFFDGSIWRKLVGSGNPTIPSSNISDSTAAGRALLTSASAAAQRVTLNIDQATLVNDANQTVTSAMESVVWTALTAPRTATLPAASTMSQGQAIFLYDESGNCSHQNPITLAPSGSDVLVGSQVIQSPNSGVAVIKGSSTKLTALSLTPAMPGFRNRIINGDMSIDQRNSGAAQTFTAGAALTYSVDRFYAFCTGANVTGQRIADSNANDFKYRFTIASPVTAIGFGQRIEARNCWDMAGATAVLSVKLANSNITTVSWQAFYANTADTFGTLASPTRTSIASGTFTVSSTIARYAVTIAIPSAATTGIEIVLSIGAQSTGTWDIKELQLERSPVSTSFERLPTGLVSSLCFRYFFQTLDNFSPSDYSPSAGSVYNHFLAFPEPMRAAPTATSTFSAATNCTAAVSANTRWATISLTSNISSGTNIFATYNAGNSFTAEL